MWALWSPPEGLMAPPSDRPAGSEQRRRPSRGQVVSLRPPSETLALANHRLLSRSRCCPVAGRGGSSAIALRTKRRGAGHDDRGRSGRVLAVRPALPPSNPDRGASLATVRSTAKARLPQPINTEGTRKARVPACLGPDLQRRSRSSPAFQADHAGSIPITRSTPPRTSIPPRASDTATELRSSTASR